MNNEEFKLELLTLDEAIAATAKTLKQLKLIRQAKLQKQYPAQVLNPETGESAPLIQTVPDLSRDTLQFIAENYEEFCSQLMEDHKVIIIDSEVQRKNTNPEFQTIHCNVPYKTPFEINKEVCPDGIYRCQFSNGREMIVKCIASEFYEDDAEGMLIPYDRVFKIFTLDNKPVEVPEIEHLCYAHECENGLFWCRMKDGPIRELRCQNHKFFSPACNMYPVPIDCIIRVVSKSDTEDDQSPSYNPDEQ